MTLQALIFDVDGTLAGTERDGLQASLGAGVPAVAVESGYTRDQDFHGASAVLSDRGEPGRPGVVRGGTLHGKACVDPGPLRAWYREAISNI